MKGATNIGEFTRLFSNINRVYPCLKSNMAHKKECIKILEDHLKLKGSESFPPVTINLPASFIQEKAQIKKLIEFSNAHKIPQTVGRCVVDKETKVNLENFISNSVNHLLIVVPLDGTFSEIRVLSHLKKWEAVLAPNLGCTTQAGLQVASLGKPDYTGSNIVEQRIVLNKLIVKTKTLNLIDVNYEIKKNFEKDLPYISELLSINQSRDILLLLDAAEVAKLHSSLTKLEGLDYQQLDQLAKEVLRLENKEKYSENCTTYLKYWLKHYQNVDLTNDFDIDLDNSALSKVIKSIKGEFGDLTLKNNK